MKTALYVATVARTYRKASLTIIWNLRRNIRKICHGISNRSKAAHTASLPRDFSTEKPSEETQIYDNNTYEKDIPIWELSIRK